VKMRLIEDFIGRMGEVMHGANVSVMPADLAHLKGVLTALGQNLGQKRPATAGRAE
jgi:hypothetical protein